MWINDEEKKVWTEKPYETKVSLKDGLYTIKVKAVDKDGSFGVADVRIGVNLPWNWSPSPTATITPVPPTATPTAIVPTAVMTVAPTVVIATPTGIGST